MSAIGKVIGRQAFEVIHDRLGGILKEELDSQFFFGYDADLANIKVWKERDVPFNVSELPAINVTLEKGDFEMQTLAQQTGVYRYNVDVIGNAASAGNVMGDQLAMNRVQKIMGKLMAIIRSPKFTTLAFTPPFISNRHVENMFFGKPVRQDAEHTVMGRFVVVVTAIEHVDFVDPVPARGTTARIYLGLTEQGYLWTSEFGGVFDYYFDVTFD